MKAPTIGPGRRTFNAASPSSTRGRDQSGENLTYREQAGEEKNAARQRAPDRRRRMERRPRPKRPCPGQDSSTKSFLCRPVCMNRKATQRSAEGDSHERKPAGPERAWRPDHRQIGRIMSAPTERSARRGSALVACCSSLLLAIGERSDRQADARLTPEPSTNHDGEDGPARKRSGSSAL